MASDGLGTITWWGFTPALDLLENDIIGCLEDIKQNKNLVDDAMELNILLIGCGDMRHVLKTIAQRFRHEKCFIHFYILESRMEVYARAILQMAISMESQSLQDKTELFLELYGNTLIRKQSMDYVINMSDEFIKMVTDFDYLASKLPFLDLSLLRFKERDFLEFVFKMWRDKEKKRDFDSLHCWDLRLRKNLGVRYDAVPNVFDWDCSITLHERGADVMNFRQYGHWRHKGVAFELRDANYDVSNRTLASGQLMLTADGDRTARIGYWGDIVCSPYLSFGIRSENQSLFKKSNNVYMTGPAQISEYNVLTMFYQLRHQKEYEESKQQSMETITEEDSETDNSVLDDISGVKIHFLPINFLKEMTQKSRYRNLFDLIYFSSSLAHLLKTTSDLTNILHTSSRVAVESSIFMVELKKEQIQAFVDNITMLAADQGLKPLAKFDPLKDHNLLFEYQQH